MLVPVVVFEADFSSADSHERAGLVQCRSAWNARILLFWLLLHYL